MAINDKELSIVWGSRGDGMQKLAVLILTYNEEKNIRDCIASASFADEIVVVDSGSTDNTREIAQELGVKVHLHPFEDFATQRNVALEQTDANWVFYLDADERISPAAAKSIRQAAERNERITYTIRRENIVFGQKMKYGPHCPDYPRRMYPRDSVRWEGVVHEGAVTNLGIKKLDGYIDHYTYTSWNKYYSKFNQYTSLMADKMYDRGKRASFVNIILHPLFGFFRVYILNLGFLEGKLGFIMSVNHYFYTLVKYVKLYYRDCYR